ncbi:sugar-binding transcriptional regulator [Acaricomes phytoseiuli]|uniref:sugar-binding transcriptional regulator n=1 Tax=Acaricomes phytoseiuli TaxID=291968 RepID=UPI000477E339|nr:sugar-binding domain-containing protein [Acaricomes phytoseiuli]
MARTSSFDTADSLRVAQMYYLQDQTMDAIARELRTSRSTISRLLSAARESGLVEVQIRPRHDRAPELARLLRERYSVDVHVVPVPGILNEGEVLERVAMQAARTISPLIDSDAVIGLAWGSTLSALSRHLQPKATHDCTFVQLNGAGNTRTSGIAYASEILGRFGHAFGARVVQFPVPTFFDQASTKRAMWQERSVQRILDWQQRMSMVIFSVGSVEAELPSRVYAGGYLDAADRASLEADDAVGDIATVFFRADGSAEGIALNERSSGPSLELLRSIRRRVCVVSGQAKAASLQGALAAGLVTELILDEASARRLADAG